MTGFKLTIIGAMLTIAFACSVLLFTLFLGNMGFETENFIQALTPTLPILIFFAVLGFEISFAGFIRCIVGLVKKEDGKVFNLLGIGLFFASLIPLIVFS